MRERTAMNRRKNTIRKQLTISYVFLILLSTVLLNIVQFCQIYKYTKDQQQNEIEKEFIQTKNNIQTVLSQINTIRCQANMVKRATFIAARKLKRIFRHFADPEPILQISAGSILQAG